MWDHWKSILGLRLNASRVREALKLNTKTFCQVRFFSMGFDEVCPTLTTTCLISRDARKWQQKSLTSGYGRVGKDSSPSLT